MLAALFTFSLEALVWIVFALLLSNLFQIFDHMSFGLHL